MRLSLHRQFGGLAVFAVCLGMVGCGSKSAKVDVPNTAVTTAPETKDPVAEERAKLSPDDRASVEAQEWCVVSNEGRLGAMGAPIKLMMGGKPVFVCCEGCVKTAEKDPDATLAKLAELKAKKAATASSSAMAAPATTTPATATAETTAAAPAAPAKAPGKLVDAKEALKNPKVVLASTKITGEDPLTASMQAYFSVRAKAQILNFQNQVKITRALYDDKPLPYDEFAKLAEQMKIEFIDVLPWQMIGYDATTSELVILEDKGVKIQHFKAKNIPLEAGDEKFDTP